MAELAKTKQSGGQGRFKAAAIIICLLLTVGSLFFAGLKYLEYYQSYGEINAKREEIAELEHKAERLNELLIQYRESISRLEAKLFEEKNVPLFIEGVSTEAKRFRVKISRIRALAVERIDPQIAAATSQAQRVAMRQEEDQAYTLISTPFNIEIEGVYKDIVRFLLSLEKHPQALTLTNVKIETSDYPLLTCSFRLDLYSLKQLREIEEDTN